MSGRVGEGHEQERYSWNWPVKIMTMDVRRLLIYSLIFPCFRYSACGLQWRSAAKKTRVSVFQKKYLPNVISWMFIRDVFSFINAMNHICVIYFGMIEWSRGKSGKQAPNKLLSLQP